jgi:virginiamycin A acetyltransferase
MPSFVRNLLSAMTHQPQELRLAHPSTATFQISGRIKSCFKWSAIALGMVIAAFPALTSKVERYLSNRDAFFLFWGHTFALVPGLPGNYIRKCFYYLTLRRCPLNCEIGFMTYIHDRRAQIAERVYIGAGVGIGWVCIGDGCLIASRVSILSGDSQHRLDSDGRLTPFDRLSARRIKIGEETWIGEGAIIMADVDSRCIVGAGSIIRKPIPSGFMATGNPARLIRNLVERQDSPPRPDEETQGSTT